MTNYTKPLPDYANKFKEFWAGCKLHKLLVQRCANCGTYRWYPRLGCHNCGSFESAWTEVKGQGKVYSYVTILKSPLPAFRDDVPYNVVVVELDHVPGVRMLGRLTNCPHDKVAIGMPVEVDFEDVTEQVSLANWRPTDPGKKPS